MAREKKPSIYTDRGAIGSSDELDEYGVWVKSEAQDISEVPSDIPLDESLEPGDSDFAIPDMDELPDFNVDKETEDDFEIPEISDELDSFEPLPLETGSDDDDLFNIEDDEEFQETPEDLGFNEISYNDLTETAMNDSSFSPNTSDFSMDEISEEISFEDNTTKSATETTFDNSSVKQNSTQDLSTQLLLRIADELSSIRNELTKLKKDFTNIKVDPHQHKEDADHGFFEEEDEKIALTGDELNNILNTADFTEETGMDPTGEDIVLHTEDNQTHGIISSDDDESEVFSIDDLDAGIDMNMDLEDSDAMEDISINEDINEDISINDIEEIDLPSFDTEATDELLELSESGAKPITSAPEPEEEVYLEEDIDLDDGNILDDNEELDTELDIVEFDDFSINDNIDLESNEDLSETLDLSEAVIEEPDIDMEIQDNPIEEPSLDSLSIELDLEEDFSLDSEDEEELIDFSEAPALSDDDITLDDMDMDIGIDAGIQLDEPGIEFDDAGIQLDDAGIEFDEAGIELDEPGIDLDDPGMIIEELEEEPEYINIDDILADDFPEVDILSSDISEDMMEEDFSGEDLQENDLQELMSPGEGSQSTESFDESFVDTMDDSLDETIDESIDESFLDDTSMPDFSMDMDDNVPNIDILMEDTPTVENLIKGSGQALEDTNVQNIPAHLYKELKTVLSYMDGFLESLPEEKIEEFARSKYFETYKKLFKELGLE